VCQSTDLIKKHKTEVFGKIHRELRPIKAASGLIKKNPYN
jgi:hypothetical protein